MILDCSVGHLDVKIYERIVSLTTCTGQYLIQRKVHPDFDAVLCVTVKIPPFKAFTLLESNTDLIRSLASDSMLWSISEVIRNSIHDELLDHLTQDQRSGRDLAAQPELLTEFIIGALEQTVRWWFTDADPLPPEDLREQMSGSILRLIS